jgi:hypothetical protein
MYRIMHGRRLLLSPWRQMPARSMRSNVDEPESRAHLPNRPMEKRPATPSTINADTRPNPL